MNTPLPPSDDELVSAYLDGDVTPAERAQVEGDPALLAQVERFRLVVAALREPVTPPDPVRKEQAIAAALGVLDGSVVPFPAGERPLPPPAARPAGRRPNRRPNRWLTLAAAAAVAAVVAVAGVALTSGDDNDVASPTTETEPTGTTGTSGNSAFPPDPGVPTSPPAIARVIDLGSFDTMDALIEAVDARPESGERAPGRTVTHQCRPIGAQAAYTATVAGDEVVVFLAPQTESRLLTEGTVYAAADCTQLETFSLA
jgi:hypothetical protein